MKRIPLAWQNLTYDKRRLTVAVCGIAFSVVLMFQQRGFQNALFDSTVEIVRDLDCDLIILKSTRFSLSVENRFERYLLEIAAAQSGVRSVTPLYIENLAARLRSENQKARPIRVMGFDVEQPVFRSDHHAEIHSQLPQLHAPATALMDRLSRSDYGFDTSSTAHFPQVGELNGNRIEIVGTFRSGRDFAHSGNLLMSEENFRRYFRHRGKEPLSQVDLGLLKLDHPTRANEVGSQLQKTLGEEVQVLSRQAFIDREIAFWNSNTPIGVIFKIGTVMGFVVGVIICYQVLANAIADHLAEFATLKAMGYRNRYFVQLTIRQSLYLACLGFLPGLMVSWALFQYNAQYTALPMNMTVLRVTEILLATMGMCIVSGILALRKLFAADPASLF